MTNFEFEDDRTFFGALLCHDSEAMSAYAELFDFRPPEVKRREFAKVRGRVLREKLAEHGEVCQLWLGDTCDVTSGLVLDHLIPLSSNQLNKTLRGLVATRTPEGKLVKAPTQSFGSNHPRNLILACAKCNGRKKHRFLDREAMRRILLSQST